MQFDGSRAMAAGVMSKLWEISDVVKVLGDWELARISVTTVLTKYKVGTWTVKYRD